ncbi:DMT family transporter [Hahella ganghwensis]|uniref:DMT family transporter n=1 Tax=Hahella ganghwensis TaxID=286420 RepID=UPI000475AE39|nr:DMT family transporter [Hahella ganghwensis]
MVKISGDWVLALGAGVLLAVMININSQLAEFSSPVVASWVAHGVGGLAAWGLCLVVGSRKHSVAQRQSRGAAAGRIPFWCYLGGVPGAMTVVLAAVTVNSPLGLSGSLALMLVGQILFGLLCDYFGLFGIPRRKLQWRDAHVSLCTISGAGIIIFS